MQAPQQSNYIHSTLLNTRRFILSTYERFPIKAPALLEQTISKVDKLSEPMLTKVSSVADTQLNKTLYKIEPLRVKIMSVHQTQVLDRFRELKSQGRVLQAHVKDTSTHLVDLAIHNKASQAVLTSVDSLTDKVFNSIESHITDLAQLTKVERRQDRRDNDKSQRGSLKNYHSRVMVLAHDVSDISNQLYTILKREVVSKPQVSLYAIKARAMVLAHYSATLHTSLVIVFRPALAHFAQNIGDFKACLTYLQTKYNNKELITYLREQLLGAQQYLNIKQIQKLYKATREIITIDEGKKIVEQGKEQIKYIQSVYSDCLVDEQKEIENKYFQVPQENENEIELQNIDKSD